MFRRGRLQRSLITLLALLIVTPQVLLRPCCCAQERPAAAPSTQHPEQTPALPPCCLKRLQASQKSAATKVVTQVADSRAGIHDSGRCGCRVSNQAARTNRTVFNETLARHSVVWTAQPVDAFAVGQLTQSQVLTTAAHSAFPDWGPESCARLCRWIV